MSTRLKLFVLSTFCACISGCNSSSQIETPAPVEDSETLDNNEDATEPTDSLFESESNDIDEGSSSEIDYPTLTYSGSGTTTFESKTLNTTVEFATEIDDEKLELESYRLVVSCSGISGCKQGEVDAQLGKLEGTDIFRRVSMSDRVKIGDQYDDSLYAIFSDRVISKDGIEFTFAEPLPVYPWPAKKSRYEPLEKRNKTFETTVKASKPVAGKTSFSAKIKIELESLTEHEARISFDLTLREDSDYQLYGAFPISKHSEYVIDLDDQNVTEVEVVTYFNNAESGREQARLKFELCEKESKSGKESFSCR